MYPVGLYEQDIDSLLLRASGLPSNLTVSRLEVDPVIRVLDDFAVDSNATRADPAARIRSRSESCLRQDSVQVLSGRCLPVLLLLKPVDCQAAQQLRIEIRRLLWHAATVKRRVGDLY